MNIVYFLLPMALVISVSFAVGFIIAALRGQFDDLETPAHRILLEDTKQNEKQEPQGKRI